MRVALVGLLLIGAVSVRAQDVGFANAWPELTPHLSLIHI